MILNGEEILQYHSLKKIEIDPWDKKRVGANSYDVCLYPIIRRYISDKDSWYLDPKKDNKTIEITIPDSGFILHQGDFILGSTNEINNNYTDDLVPMIEGRSSIARLGLTAHAAAGFGDVGFCGRWTLEIIAALPVIIYPFMPIAQLYWVRTTPTPRKYQGKYLHQQEAVASKIFLEMRDGR